MPTGQHHFVRTDTLELKSQIEKKIGPAKTKIYLNLLSKFLSFQISKSDFDKLIVATVKKENISLHNALLREVLKNACLSKTPPLIKNGVEEEETEEEKKKKQQLNGGFQTRLSDRSERTERDHNNNGEREGLRRSRREKHTPMRLRDYLQDINGPEDL